MALARGCGYVLYRLDQPYRGFSDPVFVEFPRGTSTGQMAATLAARRPRATPGCCSRRARCGVANLQAGEYRFDKPASALDVYGRIARGDIYYMELLVPEGYNMFDIAAAVEKLGYNASDDFLAAARNPAPIRDLDPKRGDRSKAIFSRTNTGSIAIPARSRSAADDRRIPRAVAGSQYQRQRHDTVTLAAMVEREASSPKSVRRWRPYSKTACGSA